MEDQPRTRQEKKGKGKEKQAFNQKTVRLKLIQQERRENKENTSGKRK